MINSFFGLELGKRALDYFRRGMETAGHNISNADVEGYSRQRVEPSTTSPFTNPAFNRPDIPGQVGTGVQIDSIVRLRDAFASIPMQPSPDGGDIAFVGEAVWGDEAIRRTEDALHATWLQADSLQSLLAGLGEPGSGETN